MQREQTDFEAHLAAAFASQMDRADRREIANAVLAEVARADGRRNLLLVFAGLFGGLLSLGAAAAVGLLQDVARLLGALSTEGAAPLADPGLAGALTWSLALIAAMLVTLITGPGPLQEP